MHDEVGFSIRLRMRSHILFSRSIFKKTKKREKAKQALVQSVLYVLVDLHDSLLLSVDEWLCWCMVKGAENWRRNKRWLYCIAILMHHVQHHFSQVQHHSEMHVQKRMIQNWVMLKRELACWQRNLVSTSELVFQAREYQTYSFCYTICQFSCPKKCSTEIWSRWTNIKDQLLPYYSKFCVKTLFRP